MEKSAIITYFEEISKIPHGSENEKQISDYLMDFAKTHELWAHQDDIYNVLIKKDASAGMENTPALLLQGHIDMVCEKNSCTSHDFTKDPLQLYIDGDLLRAKDTTLGADDGVAVAYMMALLEDETFIHPPLECLFTVQEETGLVGAYHIDSSLISARRMINLDCEEEDTVFVSCAGGMRATVIVPGEKILASGEGIIAEISGLLGGHSGMDIAKQRGNSNKIAGRILFDLSEKMNVGLAFIAGGEKDNAIPRECSFSVFVPEGRGEDALKIMEETAAEIKKELQFDDAGFAFSVKRCINAENMFSYASSKNMIDLIYLVPNGILSWSTSTNIPSCSLNLGKITTTDEGAVLTHCLRSSMDTMKKNLCRQLEVLSLKYGASYKIGSIYPAWEYKKESPFRDSYIALYKNRHGEEPKIMATHGGLECGILTGKLPGLDIVAFGPNCFYVHTPNEALNLNSFESTYQTLRAFIETLR